MGYGEKSLNLLIDYAFNIMMMKNVKLSVFDFNTGAIRCYENAGFSITGKAVRPNGWTVLEMERTKDSE